MVSSSRNRIGTHRRQHHDHIYDSFYGFFPKELPQAMNHHAALLHGDAIVLEHIEDPKFQM
jgi:hypothetical protein